MNKKHFLLFVVASMLLSSCSMYRCRPMQHLKMTASNVATTNTFEVAIPVEPYQANTSPTAQKEVAKVAETAVVSVASNGIKSHPAYTLVKADQAMPQKKLGKLKLIRELKKLKHSKPNDASDFFSDKNILIMSLACILAAFSTFGLLFLISSTIIPAIIAFLVWLILATIIKLAIRNEFDDYEPWTKIVAIIAYSIFPVLFLVWYVLAL